MKTKPPPSQHFTDYSIKNFQNPFFSQLKLKNKALTSQNYQSEIELTLNITIFYHPVLTPAVKLMEANCAKKFGTPCSQ